MERRTLLQITTAALVSPLRAAEVCGTPPPDAAQLRFFTAEEDALLDRLMELILPADEHSPGAHEARVSRFADWMVSNGSAELQRQWRDGLKEISGAAALAEAAANETPFFVQLKTMTVHGYYTSQVGIQKDLEYRGNEYCLSFPGCTHPEHQG